MTAVRSKVQSSEDVILRKLVVLARGDVSLVAQALRAVRQDNEPVDLDRLITYITERLANREGQRRVHEPA